jgi:hypothetical protein
VISSRLSLSFSLEKKHQAYLSDRLDSVREIASIPMNHPDAGMNLAIVNVEGLLLNEREMEAFRKKDSPQNLCQFQMLYHQFMYPLIVWTGSGWRGTLASDKLQGSTTLIRKDFILPFLKPHDHFIH